MHKASSKRVHAAARLHHFVNLIVLSILTGLFSGVVVTFYNILTSLGEEASVSLYSLVRDNPAFVPLLFLGLAAGAFVIGAFLKLVPMIRGSGVPQIEGAARGRLRFRWYAVMCSMFAASLACVFMGLPAGSEGPSLEIGGCAGDGVGAVLRRTRAARRLQIAAGSSAGLATAFNAPVTGLIFAMEEAFRSFSAQVFVCSSVSVIVALAARNLIRAALGFSTGFTLTSYSFSAPDAMGWLWIFIAALAAALLGVAFYHAMLLCRRLFARITFFKGLGKYLVPFLAAGAFGLISVYAMGGGHAFLQDLGTGGTGNISIERALGLGVAATLAIVVVLRFLSCALAVGAGMPYGIFVPTLATGAGLGALLCCAFSAAGMDGSYADYLIIITMAAYFTTVVRAPVTGLVMIFEFTGSFANLLPALMGVAVGYIVGELFRTQPLFEKLLEFIVRERGEDRRAFRVSAEVEEGSAADGRRIRSLLWPLGGAVVAVQSSGGDTLAVSQNLRLSAGDVVTFEARASSEEELLSCLEELTSVPVRRKGDGGEGGAPAP